jgi:hypothetical protein
MEIILSSDNKVLIKIIFNHNNNLEINKVFAVEAASMIDI